MLGDLVGGNHDRNAKVIGAGIGALAGGAVGHYMDRQEAELRRQTAGTGVDVYRQGDELVLADAVRHYLPGRPLRHPAAIPVDLDQVAQTLSSYNQTYIDVLGHTDSTGSDAYNQTLSQRRAQSVSDYLAGRGVARARIASRGYGESQPIASNDTDTGRAENRRVEIKVVRSRSQDTDARISFGGPRRKNGAAPPLRPRRFRRAHRAGDGRSAARRIAGH